MARIQSKKRYRLGFAKSPHSTSNVNPSSQRASQTSANVASLSATPGTFSRMKRFFHQPKQSQSGLVAKEPAEMSTDAGILEQARAASTRKTQMTSDNPGPAPMLATSSKDAGITPNALDAVPVSRSSKLIPVDIVTRRNTSLTEAQHFHDTHLKPLKTFNVIAPTMAFVHPYVQLALGVLIATSQCIINQARSSDKVPGLLSTVSKVYVFLVEDDTIEGMENMRETLGTIARVMSDATRFIINHPGTKNFWNRIRKKGRKEIELVASDYVKSLNDLMQQYRGRTVRDTGIKTHRALEDSRLDGMAYVGDAGLDTTKVCLDGTRTEILREIINWIITPDLNAPHILWLHGQAGRGKSAIAHTISSWMQNVGGLGTIFCFARDRQAEQMEEKILSTIALGLADHDPAFQRALENVVGKKKNRCLKTTPGVMQQWKRLILEPLSKINGQVVGNVVVVIDGLDESGSEMSRAQILSLLGSMDSVPLSANFRILLTSRALPDIERAMRAAPHVKAISLDGIPPQLVERDIRLYVSKELRRLPGIGVKEVQNILKESNGLFEWAHLACKFIKSIEGGATPKQRYDDLMALESGEGKMLLDATYSIILKNGIPQSREALEQYRSVMRQIVMTLEPLPVVALSRIHEISLSKAECYDITLVLGSISPVLAGIVDRSTPVQPLHPSFYGFLMDPSRSGVYFMDNSDTQGMTFAMLQILRDELRFNICGLESSYLANTEVSDLSERIQNNIPRHLSYSCQFWAQHLEKTAFDPTLAVMVKAIVGSEKIIFWLEVMSLLGMVGKCEDALASVAKWILGQDGFEDVLALVEDEIKFIQSFSSVMLHSTPHLYVSAITFIPPNTLLSAVLMPKFPYLARVAVGGLADWPAIQLALLGHTSEVSSVAFSPDGRRVVSGSLDKTVRMWDIRGGVQIGSPFGGHTSDVNAVAFSPDGKMIVSGSRDVTVRLWDVESHMQTGNLLEGHTSFVDAVAFSPDGKKVASGSFDETVRVWDVERGVQIGKPLQHISAVRSVAFSPDGRKIVSGSVDNTVRVWDVERGVQIGDPLDGHDSGVRSVAFSPDGKRVASGSRDFTVRIWDIERGMEIGKPLNNTSEVSSVTFSSDGKWIISGGGTVRVWDVEGGVQIGNPLSLEGHNGVRSVAISPDGKRVVSGMWKDGMRVWDIERGMQISGPLDHMSAVSSVTFCPDGKKIVSGSLDKTVRVWDVERGVQIGSPLQGHTSFVHSVALSPDGRRIVSGSSDKTLRVWDVEGCMQIGSSLEGYASKVYSVAFLPDGKRIVSGGDGPVRVWDIERGAQIGSPLEGHTSKVHSVATSLDGKKIASGSSDKTVRVWDVEGGVQIGSALQGHTTFVTSVAFSPDGKRIVSGSLDKTVRIWDVEQGVQIGRPLQCMFQVKSVAFAPDGSKIVSGSVDGAVAVWDVESGVQIGGPLQGHTSSVTSVAFSPDGKRIVSGSLDKTVRVWDVGRSMEIGRPLQEHTPCIDSAPGRKRIHSVSSDKDVAVCDAQSHEDMVSAHEKSLVKASTPCTAAPTTYQLENVDTGYQICFSSVPSHALHNSKQLVYGFKQEDASMWAEPVKLHHDGWIRGPKGRLLLWIPVVLRMPFYSMWNTVVIPRGCCTELDLSQMAHGEEWWKCFKVAT